MGFLNIYFQAHGVCQMWNLTVDLGVRWALFGHIPSCLRAQVSVSWVWRRGLKWGFLSVSCHGKKLSHWFCFTSSHWTTLLWNVFGIQRETKKKFCGLALWQNVCRVYLVLGVTLTHCSLACSQNHIFYFRFNFESRWLDLFILMLSFRKFQMEKIFFVLWVIFMYCRVFGTVLKGCC